MNTDNRDNSHQLMMLITKLTFFTGIIMALVGVALLVLEGAGKSTISLFGQEISTSNAGLGAVFVAAVMITLTIKRILNIIGKNN